MKFFRRKRVKIALLLVPVLILFAIFVYLLINITITGKLITGKQTVYGFFIIEPTPPNYSNVQQSRNVIYQGDSVTLSAYWRDDLELDYAWLETNETGFWENKIGIHGSPLKLNGNSSWSNFTWNNPSVPANTTVGWRIHANDTSNNENSTYIKTFFLITPPSPPITHPGVVTPPIPTILNFTLDKEFIKVSLGQGETATEKFRINNNGNENIEIRIEKEEGISRLVSTSSDFFVLKPGEGKDIVLAVSARENEEPEIYSGNLIITGGGIEKEVLIVIEVKEKRPLFDLKVVLDETPLVVSPGDYVEADIIIYNLGEEKPVDVNLYYSLRDIWSGDLFFEEETFMVEGQKLLYRKIRIPEDIKPGYYLFYAKVAYDNQTATSSGLIKVILEEKEEVLSEPPLLEYLIGITWVSIIIILLFVFIIYRKTKVVVFETRVSTPPVDEGKEKSKGSELEMVSREVETLMYMIRMLRGKSTENEIIMQSGREKTVNVSIRSISKTYTTINLNIEGLPEPWYEIKKDSEYSTKTGSYAKFKVTFKPPSTVKRGYYKFFYVAESYGAKETYPAVLRIFETEEETIRAEIKLLNKQVRVIRSLIESGKSMGKDMTKAEKMLKMIKENIKKVEGELG